MSETAYLTEKLKSIPITSTMTPIHCGIKGKAFFPGGRGLWNDEDETISNKKYMILGQDFDTLRNYKSAEKSGSEDLDGNNTWRNLLDFFISSNIDKEDCFYTNAILGARPDGSNKGASPAFQDESYLKACQEYFLEQLRIQKPVIVLVLGKMPARFLSPLATAGSLSFWSNKYTFKELDEKRECVKKNIEFSNGITTDLVLLVHPSMNNSNLRYRAYKGMKKNDAQVMMVN